MSALTKEQQKIYQLGVQDGRGLERRRIVAWLLAFKGKVRVAAELARLLDIDGDFS